VSLSLRPLHFKYVADNERLVQVERRVVDEEKLLDAIPRNSQEAIVSCLSLHWVNDLPGMQLRALTTGVDTNGIMYRRACTDQRSLET